MGHRDAQPKGQLQKHPERYLQRLRLHHRTSLFGVELLAELSRLRTGASTPSTASSEAIVQKALRLSARIACPDPNINPFSWEGFTHLDWRKKKMPLEGGNVTVSECSRPCQGAGSECTPPRLPRPAPP